MNPTISKLIIVLIIAGAVYGVVELFEYFKGFQRTETRVDSAAGFVTADPFASGGGGGGTAPGAAPAGEVPADTLAGLRPEYDASLKAAYKGGVDELGKWLRRFGPYTADPRRAAIELDYASLLMRTDPATAKKIYAAVAKRTPADSPIYPRVKRVESIYK